MECVMTKFEYKAIVICSILLLLSIYGCSLIGLGIGKVVDSARKDSYSEVPGWDIKTIEPGAKIQLFLNNGETVYGEFLAPGTLEWSKYKKKYEKYREELKNDILLPVLADTIVAIDTAGNEWEIEYFGLDGNSVRFRDGKQAEPRNVDFRRVERIVSSAGDTIRTKTIQDLAYKAPPPSSTTIIIREIDDHGRRVYSRVSYLNPIEIPLDEIQQLHFKDKERGALSGFILGALVDIIVIAILATDDDDPPPRTTPTNNTGQIMCGCPFIYSFDGDDYILDSEAFGGSIFKAAERTDLDRLDNLKETGGVCRLKIADMLLETDYIDEVKLLVIDHDPGIEIIPSFAGRLHALKEMKNPIAARDFSGSDVLGLINEKDDLYWTSNQFRQVSDTDGIRDGIELEFARPVDSKDVNLVFNIKNTVWAALMQSAYLKAHGNKIDDWYRLMNSSGEARDEVIEAFIREGMLSVYLWDGEDWSPSGFVWEIGTTVFRDQVLRIDIGDNTGESIRVRLESTSGFWVINSVKADFSPENKVDFTEITPYRAIDRFGSNRLEMIGDTDERYYIMNTGDWVNLEFRLPEPVDGTQRTYILKTSGYYKIDTQSDDEPRVELLERFLREPGAFGRYTTDMFEKYYRCYMENQFAQKSTFSD
jgi:hypothetical protein